MSQPHYSDHPDPDPLQAFVEEPQAAAAPEPVETAEAAKPVAKSADSPTPPADDPTPDFRRRLQCHERQIERALIDLATLKTDLATLVGAVDDIKKQVSRPATAPARVMEPPLRRRSGPRAIAAILILLTAGVAWWGFVSAATDDLPAPPPVENETSSAAEIPPTVEPAPAVASEIAVAGPAPRIIQAAAASSPPPARAAPALAETPRAKAASPKRSGEGGSRVVTYVGTLTVDAEPAGDVYLNRKNVGRTPVRLENLRAGSHLIWIEREGYRRWTRVVAVAADRVSRVSASLDPLSR